MNCGETERADGPTPGASNYDAIILEKWANLKSVDTDEVRLGV